MRIQCRHLDPEFAVLPLTLPCLSRPLTCHSCAPGGMGLFHFVRTLHWDPQTCRGGQVLWEEFVGAHGALPGAETSSRARHKLIEEKADLGSTCWPLFLCSVSYCFPQE